jgi:hypothetical protein
LSGKLADAWQASVAALLDPRSPLRRSFADLPRSARLSPAGLDAGLRCLARGVRAQVFAALQEHPTAPPGGLDVVILPGNLPALFLQQLARSLAARRSVLLKPSANDCGLAEAFVADLTERLPALTSRVSCRRWKGGDRGVEEAIFAVADRVIAYGDSPALTDLVRRTAKKLVRHGPKTSLAISTTGPSPALADAVARDVSLFDQRGCLSASVFLAPATDIEAWGGELREALGRAAIVLPPGAPDPTESLAVHQGRAEAAMRGARVLSLDGVAQGAVILERAGMPRPLPLLRTLQVLPLDDRSPSTFTASRGSWQGLALVGEVSSQLRSEWLAATGVSRVAPAGQLQEADATWDDGEREP